MTTSVTEDRTIDGGTAGARPHGRSRRVRASLPPRGTDPSLPPDADPEPLPIGIARHGPARPEDVSRGASLLPQARAAPAHDREAPGELDPAAPRAAGLHHRGRPFGHDVPRRLHRPHPGDHLSPRAAGHEGRRPLRLRGPLGLPALALVLPPRLRLARARGARRGPALLREDAHQHLPHPVPGAGVPRLAVHPHHPRRARRGLLAHAQALAAGRGRLVRASASPAATSMDPGPSSGSSPSGARSSCARAMRDAWPGPGGATRRRACARARRSAPTRYHELRYEVARARPARRGRAHPRLPGHPTRPPRATAS